MKNLYNLVLLSCSLFVGSAYAQVGIGTTNPKAQLDIRSTVQATPTNTDGVLIPKIDNFPLTNPTLDQDGMMVYATGLGTPPKGFYYWDNAILSWTPVAGSGGVEKIDDLSDGKSDANGSSLYLGVDAGINDDGTNNNNVGVGSMVLTSNTTGFSNTAFGQRSLEANTAGTYNTASGLTSLKANTTGTHNTASGLGALSNNTTGSFNTAFGLQSLYLFQTGFYNTAIGYHSGRNAVGSYNIFLGASAGYFETGSNKLYVENSDADADNALIYGEFDNNLLRINGHLKLPVESDAGPTPGSGVLEIGGALRLDSNEIITNTNMPLHLQADNDGKLQVGFTDFVVDTELGRTGVGTATPLAKLDIRSSNQATPANTDGILIPKANNFPVTNPGANQDGMFLYATGLGTPTKGLYYWDNTAVDWVAVVGAKKINDLSDGKSDANGSSVFLGVGAGTNDDGTDNKNVGVGYQSFISNTTGVYNSAIGYQSLMSNTSGYSNSANGYQSLKSNTSGSYNVASGSEALTSNTTGDLNTASGGLSLHNNTGGEYNAALGSYSLVYNTIGNKNTGLGSYTLRGNTEGDYNTASGYGSLYTNSTGNYNTALGSGSGFNTIGDANVFLGYRAGYNETGSNRLYIENSIANPNGALIYGEFDTNLLRINGQLQLPLGTDASPTPGSGVLEIGGSLRFDNNEIITNANTTLFIQNDNNGDLRVDGSTLVVDATQNFVGIGTSAPSTELDVVGDIEYTGTITDVSDRRLKENFKRITNVLGLIQNITGFSYNMKDDTAKKREYGVIAQDVQKVFPEMVRVIDNKEHLGVSYIQLIPVLLEAIKEQQVLIESLQQENTVYNAQVNLIHEKSLKLESRLQKLEALLLKEVAIKD